MASESDASKQLVALISCWAQPDEGRIRRTIDVLHLLDLVIFLFIILLINTKSIYPEVFVSSRVLCKQALQKPEQILTDAKRSVMNANLGQS